MIVRKLEALFTINTNAVQFKKAASQLDGLANKAETVMKTIAGYWAVQALQNFVTNTAKAMAEVGKTAEYLGITAEALQELQYAAEKSGVSVDALNDAIKEIQVRATDAKSGQGEAAEAFRMLGLSSTDAAGRIREPLELLDAVADGLKALPSHSERIWIADAIFGDEGSTVIKMLKDGSLGLRNMRQEARALGLTLGSESIAKAARFNQALTKFKKLASGIGRAIVENLLPPLSWLMERCAALSFAFNQMDSKASLVRVTLLSLGSVLAVFAAKAVVAGIKVAIAFSPMLLLFGVIAAAIVSVALIVDDLWVAFHGGESAIGRDVQKCIVFFKALGDSASEAWHAMSKGFGDAWASIQREFSTFTTWCSQSLDAVVAKLSFGNVLGEKISAGLNAAREKVGAFGDWLSNSISPHHLVRGFDAISRAFVSFGATLRGRLAGVFDGLMPHDFRHRVAAGIDFVKEKFASLHEAMSTIANALTKRAQRFLAELVPDSIKQRIADNLNFIQEKFAAFHNWILGTADELKQRLANIFDGLMPDFVKKGFLATVKHVSSPASNTPESPNLNTRLAPTPTSVLHQNRVSSNQSVNVAVNVKSGANPQEIGAEVAKVFKKEFERERFNAFMGVSQYAG
jgi:hypothetical protein